MHTSEDQFYTAVAVATVALGCIIIFFIVNMIKHQRQNVSLYKAKVQAEITTLEKERKRIASDLHDELGPLLSVVRIQINHIEVKSDDDKQMVIQASKHIDDILARTREISYDLLPNTLVRKGLYKALQEYIGKLKDLYTLHIVLVAPEDLTVKNELEINIYRMIQEIVHNTIKHANATQLLIELYHKDESLVLMTADDGKGYDIREKMDNQSGLGLFNLQSRTDVMNATFNYKSEEGVGTQYIFKIPL
jgi:signal transduction histidine kinase